jgi:hypothetical protein
MLVFMAEIKINLKEEKMKRLWLVLLSLILIAAFSASALAVDLKFSGEFYVGGMYLDKTTLQKDTATAGPSTAFYYQRLRTRADFVVSPGLTFTTRFDVMERAWGANRSAPGTAQAVDSSGTTAESENIAFDWAYVTYQSPIGQFDVGIMNDGATGTIFSNSYAPLGRIKYTVPIGPVTLTFDITKSKDASFTAKNNVAYADADNDKYGIDGTYRWKGGLAGMKVTYYNYDNNRPTANNKQAYILFTPYFIAKFGPLDIQAEVNYANGKLNQYDSGITTNDVKLENLNAFVDATATFGPVHFGGSVAYVSGDDPSTTDKQEGGTINGGREWNPCLIMFNYYDRTYWVGNLNGYANATNAGPMSNAWFFQGRVGVKPTEKLDIVASVSYAFADKKPYATAGNPATVYGSDQYGYEVDVTGTYKITNNLSYMLGFGYFMTGDFYKAKQSAPAFATTILCSTN